MDARLEAGINTDPDELHDNAHSGVTFIYYDNQLYTANHDDTHGELIHRHPDLKFDLEQSLGISLDNVRIRSLLIWRNAAVLGRTGIINNVHLCSFWNIIENQLHLCLKQLKGQKLIQDDTVVCLPPYNNPRYLMDFNRGFFPKPISPEDSKKVDNLYNMHLLRGQDKKQALMYAGAGSSYKPPLTPGRKSWAPTSESLSFKDFLKNG